jgi:formylglycine-generating enzyme required for sulfatase activity
MLLSLVVAACKDDVVVFDHPDPNHYIEPVPGKPPIEDMVRVPASADGSVKEFYIDRFEVTAAQFYHCFYLDRCESPSRIEPCDEEKVDSSKEPNRPMNCVMPVAAMEYCEYRGKRLPTRAEWLHAALGDDGRAFPWGNDPPSCKTAAIHDTACPLTKSLDVGSRPAGASPFGAQDMVGNVSEFVHDPPQLNEHHGRYAVMGGNYGSSPGSLRQSLQETSFSRDVDPTKAIMTPQQGFRCAWSADMLPGNIKIPR